MKMASPEPMLLKISQVAPALNLCQETIRRLVRAGKLPHTRINGRIRIPVRALESWIAANTTEATVAAKGASLEGR